jgi:hypothetical protein
VQKKTLLIIIGKEKIFYFLDQRVLVLKAKTLENADFKFRVGYE